MLSKYLPLRQTARADNGRGNGVIHYSNPALPIGEGHNYVMIDITESDEEEQPNDESRILPGSINDDGELIFEVSNLAKRVTFNLYKGLTIEEVEECNEFLEEKIDLDSNYRVGGFVYIPLKDFGITDVFSIGIKAPYDKNSESDSGGENSEESDDTDDDDSGNGDGSCPPGYGPDCSDWNPDGSWGKWGND